MSSADRKEKKSHLWARHPQDWYVEPEWCSERLFEVEPFSGRIWDPACGLGRVLMGAEKAGHEVFGSDIARRSDYCDLHLQFERIDRPYGRNIASNPPFGMAEDFLRLALIYADGKVALLLPLTWLSGKQRSRMLETTPLRRVYVLAPRPSMPPGPVVVAGEKPGGGTKDFAWFIWEKGFHGAPEISFLRRED